MAQRWTKTAELLSVGTEITTGETRDTNAGDLARELTALGVRVTRVAAIPDDLGAVRAAFEQALRTADLVVSTGGLGPTPDDLTREAIAAAWGETPRVDAALEEWLRDLFQRRGLPMSPFNRKQAWLIPSATALDNAHGTAPGWWVERPDGRLVVALPGPPREMWPMWRAAVLPRLRARGLGEGRATRTLRLTGIGESAVADLLGEALLRATNPEVATYARADAVDVRITAVSEEDARAGRRDARELLDATVSDLERRLAGYVFARDDEGWIQALGECLGDRRLASLEIGTGGRFAALIGDAPWLARAEVLPLAAVRSAGELDTLARELRRGTGADVALAVRARERRGDTAVTVAIATERGVIRRTRTAFLTGPEGRRRAALAACAVLWQELRPR